MANYDPNTNRMFRDDMGACTSGCKCQTRWIVEVKDGEVVTVGLTSDEPCHLRPMEKGLANGDIVIINNNYFWRVDAGLQWDFNDKSTEHKPIPLDVVDIDGDNFYREPCESIEYAEYDLCEEMCKKPDGKYVATVEYACYERDVWYGQMEPANDVVFEVEPAPKEE